MSRLRCRRTPGTIWLAALVGATGCTAPAGVPPGPVPAAAAPAGVLAPAAPEAVDMDPAALDTLDAIIERALAAGAAPGAALAVGRHGRLVRLRGYGRLAPGPDSPSVSDSTIYDLASLTKVVATTTAVMLLVERERLGLDTPVRDFFPAWQDGGPRAAVTVRNLLLHNAGLPAFRPHYRTLRGRAAFRDALAGQALDYEPGTNTVYSDLGFMMLGLIVEQVTGETLDVFVERELFTPLGLRETGFAPLDPPAPGAPFPPARPPWPLDRIAPTEQDTIFRQQRVWGVVHDENAYALGGVSGHAGLFSSARDLAVFAQLLLGGGSYAGTRLLSPQTVATFTRRASPASSRALGWDTPAPGSSAGERFSSSSFGHTGFTGTSIWVDYERDVFVVLLTNRVYGGRENQQVGALRRAVADAVQRALRDGRSAAGA